MADVAGAKPADAGNSGRRTFRLTDWDGDGKLDLIVNTRNAALCRNISTAERPWAFQDTGLMSDTILASHTTTPTTVDWNDDQIPDWVCAERNAPRRRGPPTVLPEEPVVSVSSRSCGAASTVISMIGPQCAYLTNQIAKEQSSLPAPFSCSCQVSARQQFQGGRPGS